MSKRTIKILIFLTSIILFSTATLAYALDYVNLAPLPGSCEVQANGKCITTVGEKNNLASYINGLYMLIVASAGVLAVLQIVMGGFSYVSTDAISNKEEGKHQIKMALGGLMLIFASYIILNTINPQLVELKIINDPLESIGFQEFVFITMQSQAGQQRFDSAVNKSLEELNRASRNFRETMADANALKQKTVGYRDMQKMQQLLSAGGNLEEEDAIELGILKNKYFPNKTNDELKQLIDQNIVKLGEEIKQKKEAQGAKTTEEAVKMIEEHSKNVEKLAQAQYSLEGLQTDAKQKVENYKIKVAQGQYQTANPAHTQEMLDNLENMLNSRVETINKLNLPEESVTIEMANKIRTATNDAKKALCAQVPKTISKSSAAGGTGGQFRVTIEPNPGYAPCIPITGN